MVAKTIKQILYFLIKSNSIPMGFSCKINTFCFIWLAQSLLEPECYFESFIRTRNEGPRVKNVLSNYINEKSNRVWLPSFGRKALGLVWSGLLFHLNFFPRKQSHTLCSRNGCVTANPGLRQAFQIVKRLFSNLLTQDDDDEDETLYKHSPPWKTFVTQQK